MGAMTTIRMWVSGPDVDLDTFLAAHVRRNDAGGTYLDFDTLIPCDHTRSWEGMYEAWGCRSHGWDFAILSMTGSDFECRFEVKGADAKALPILREISRRYPRLIGEVSMVTDTETWSAVGSIREGSISLTVAPWSEAMFELVEGHPYDTWPSEEMEDQRYLWRAGATARAVTEPRRTRDADLPAVGSFA
ncbi:hypothetical protein ACUXK4_004486 [Methylorubrum extorquens]